MSKESKANILVWYDGGGYSGCFWEPNFCLVDRLKNPKAFEDVYSTGKRGVTSLESAKELDGNSDLNPRTYNLKKDSEWKRFNEDLSGNPGLILGVARWLLDNREDLYRRVKCTGCGGYFDVDELFVAGFKGNGGIGVYATMLTCEQCDIKDAWDCYVKDDILRELEKRGVEFEGFTDEEVNRILYEAIDCTGACWEGEGDGRHLYRADEVVDFIDDNPSFVKNFLCQDKQLQFA